jgi:hypothetical protein
MPQAYNTTDSPIVIDDQGRTLAGHERGEIDLDVALGAVQDGGLLLQSDVPDPVTPGPERLFVGSPPPKGGAGSGADVWAAYASDNDVTVPDGASRDDIIAALDSAGVPTETEE